MILWFNGAFYDENQPLLPANAAGLTLGWGVYSTLGVLQGHAIASQRHFARLRGHAAALNINFPYDESVLLRALHEVIARNAVEAGIARLSLTMRGDGRWNHERESDLTIMAHSAQAAPIDNLKLIFSPYRLEARRALAGIKSTSHMEYQLAWLHAQKQSCDEALLCNAAGALCEGARSNLFWTQGGEIFTPSLDCGCLAGIAREIILEAAASFGMTVHEGSFSLATLTSADEVFISSATNGPRSVHLLQVEEIKYFFSSPGPLTQRLQEWWQNHLSVV